MTTIGTAVLQIIPSLDGVSKSIDSQLGGQLTAAGRNGGKALAKGVGEGLKDLERDVEATGRAYQKLKDRADDALGKVRAQEAKVIELRNQGKQNTSQYIAAEERLNTARRASGRATQEAVNGHNSLLSAQKRLGDGSVDLGGKFSSLGSLAGVAGSALASAGAVAGGAALAGIAALGAGVVIAGRQLYDLGEQFDDVFDNLRLKTGATGPALQSLEDATKRISTNVPASIASIGDVVAETHRAFKDVSGADFDNLVTNIANLNRMTGENVNVRDLGKAYRIMGVDLKDQVPTLDAFFSASENSGIGVNELISTINRGGEKLKQFGLNMGQSAALVSSFETAGVDASKVIPGLTKALNSFAKAGTDPKQGLQDTITQIKALADAGGTGGLDLANKVFGPKGGAAFYEVISSGNLDVQTLTDSVSATSDTIAQAANDTDDWAETWQKFKNKVEVAVQPLASGTFDAVNEQLEGLANWVTAHEPEIIDFFTKVGLAAVSMAEFVIKSVGLVSEGLGELLAPLTTVLSAVLKGVAVFERIGGFDDLANSLDGAANSLTGATQGMVDFGEKAKNVSLSGLYDDIKKVGERAQEASKFTTALGTATASLPDGKTITISDNSPETVARLKALGIEVQQTPNGLVVTATTDEAKRILDAFRDQETGVPITPPVQPNLGPANTAMQGFFDQWSKAVVSPQVLPANAPGSTSTNGQPNNPLTAMLPGHAGGGLISGPGSGVSDSILAWVSNREFIVNADATQKNLPLLEVINSGKLPGFADGGAVGPDVRAAQGFVGTPYSQPGRTDCSGMVARVIDGALGMPDTGLMTTKNAKEWLAARGFVPGTGGPGQISVGWYDHGPGTNDGHMAMTLSDGSNAESGGSHGTFLVGAGAKGATSPGFDQHMFLPTLYGEGPAGSASASPFAGGSAVASATGAGGSGSGSAAAPNTSSGSTGSSGFSLPSSFSGLATAPFDAMTKAGEANSGPGHRDPMAYFPKPASDAISGQIDSALGLFGVNGSPPILQAFSTLASQISIGGNSSPLSAKPNFNGAAVPDGDAHGLRAGQAPGPVFNTTIQARDAEDALKKWQHWQDVRTASKLSRF